MWGIAFLSSSVPKNVFFSTLLKTFAACRTAVRRPPSLAFGGRGPPASSAQCGPRHSRPQSDPWIFEMTYLNAPSPLSPVSFRGPQMVLPFSQSSASTRALRGARTSKSPECPAGFASAGGVRRPRPQAHASPSSGNVPSSSSTSVGMYSYFIPLMPSRLGFWRVKI